MHINISQKMTINY